MSWSKRLFDIGLALLLLPLLLPLILGIALLVLCLDGAPVFYGGERMKSPSQGFRLWKFRTMAHGPGRSGVTGGDKSAAITPFGGWLRRYRLDELPQIFNILRGDISFVGPRPPLRLYVEAAPALYREVLACRPGVTGLASLHFHHHEDWILARCQTPEETHNTYLRRCVPRKARLDLIYRENQSVCLDFAIILRTFLSMVGKRALT